MLTEQIVALHWASAPHCHPLTIPAPSQAPSLPTCTASRCCSPPTYGPIPSAQLSVPAYGGSRLVSIEILPAHPPTPPSAPGGGCGTDRLGCPDNRARSGGSGGGDTGSNSQAEIAATAGAARKTGPAASLAWPHCTCRGSRTGCTCYSAGCPLHLGRVGPGIR